MTVVFIPSRGRADLLAERVLPKWREQNVEEIIIVIEKHGYKEYRPLVRDNVSLLTLPQYDRGINYSRNFIIEKAHEWGLRKIIQADDDIYPHPSSDVNRLCSEFGGLNTLGIGIMVPFYGLMFGNRTIKAEDRPLMSKGALGKRLFSLDVERVLAIGNFDVELHSGWGDDELVRMGMAKLGATWYVHAGVWGTSVSNRFTAGGINHYHRDDLQSRQEGMEHSHRIIFARWGPRYCNTPKEGGKLRFRWKAFMDDYVPGWEHMIDWEKF